MPGFQRQHHPREHVRVAGQRVRTRHRHSTAPYRSVGALRVVLGHESLRLVLRPAELVRVVERHRDQRSLLLGLTERPQNLAPRAAGAAGTAARVTLAHFHVAADAAMMPSAFAS